MEVLRQQERQKKESSQLGKRLSKRSSVPTDSPLILAVEALKDQLEESASKVMQLEVSLK